jgi:hypothetical protein
MPARINPVGEHPAAREEDIELGALEDEPTVDRELAQAREQ